MVQYEGHTDVNLWRQLEEDEKLRQYLVAQGEKWIHTCPECGTTFENDEPGKGYLCDECGRKAIQRLREEWEQELFDMERKSARRSVPSFESEYARLKNSGHYIDDKEPEKWIEFWQMCERNDKSCQEAMKKGR